MTAPRYDALLIVSFGGPEKTEDVIPFLENILRGKNVPRERMLEVAEHYYHFGGKSPINGHNRELLGILRELLAARGPQLPVYWGNRNWHPLLSDTLRQMAADGVRRALAFVTSAYSSYSGCRQYREDIARAQQAAGPGAPAVEKLRVFYNHPGFIEVMTDRVRTAFAEVPAERRGACALVYTAHSIPVAMAQGCRYEAQLQEAARLVSAAVGRSDARVVYQSRSGPPAQPWLGPDICDYLRELRAAEGATDVVVVPIGFLSDHLEVRYDLDTQARQVAQEIGLRLVRAGTAGAHPRFVEMIRELVLERLEGRARAALGADGPSPDVCPEDCCPAPQRPAPAMPARG
jgi:ferrochelatase